MSVQLAEPTVIDKAMSEGGVKEITSIDYGKALEEAKKILESLKDFDANLAEFESPAPVVVARLSKAIVYVVVLPPGYILTGTVALKIIESLLPYLEKIKEAGKRPVLLFFSKKGKLTLACYLYLGSVIENYDVGVLFVNGERDEILEILWHLENVGKYEAPEDEIVDLKRLNEQ
ncbi:MAG: hypothetical protein F7C34_04740 [Desulfurococcales archaeon]|nr:hypothetical protein [Desulfurococcales archaeon]